MNLDKVLNGYELYTVSNTEKKVLHSALLMKFTSRNGIWEGGSTKGPSHHSPPPGGGSESGLKTVTYLMNNT